MENTTKYLNVTSRVKIDICSRLSVRSIIIELAFVYGLLVSAFSSDSAAMWIEHQTYDQKQVWGSTLSVDHK